jgi:hypothetical protein
MSSLGFRIVLSSCLSHNESQSRQLDGEIATFCRPIPDKRLIKGRPFEVGFDRFASTPTGRSTLINDAKYIGLDVHQATISAAVLDSTGKLSI